MAYYYDVTLQNDLQPPLVAAGQKCYVQYYMKIGAKGPRYDGQFFAWKRSNVVCITSNFDGLINIPDKDFTAKLTIIQVVNDAVVTKLVQI